VSFRLYSSLKQFQQDACSNSGGSIEHNWGDLTFDWQERPEVCEVTKDYSGSDGSPCVYAEFSPRRRARIRRDSIEFAGSRRGLSPNWQGPSRRVNLKRGEIFRRTGSAD